MEQWSEQDYQVSLTAIRAQVRRIQRMPFADRLSLKRDVERLIDEIYDAENLDRLRRQFSADA